MLVLAFLVISAFVVAFILVERRKYVDKGPAPEKILSDEQFIAYRLFSKSIVEEFNVRAYIRMDFLDQEIITALTELINYYSKEGFLRYLEYGEEEDDNKRFASVVLCKLLHIQYWNLWDNGYMRKRDANLIIDEIEGR